MKTSFLSLLLFSGCASVAGCSSEAAATSDERPYAYRKDAVPEETSTGGAAHGADMEMAWTGVPGFVATHEAHGALALTSIGALLSSFAIDVPTLDPTKLPPEIAAAIAARVATRLCTGGSVVYKSGSAYLTVTFGAECALPGSSLAAAGTVLVGITTGTSGKAWAAADLTFTKASIDGDTLDGYATLSSDGKTGTLTTRVALEGLGTVAFRGTAVTADGGVTLDGSGGWTGPESTTPEADEWACVSSSNSALTLRDVHRATTSCYADGGRLEVSTPYVCRRAGEPVEAQRSILTTTSMTFLTTTPATRAVTGTVSVSGGASDPQGTTMTSALVERACQGAK